MTAYYIAWVVTQNDLSTEGITLYKIQKEVDKTKMENQLLREQILEAQSLITIEKKAKDMGFVECNGCEVILDMQN